MYRSYRLLQIRENRRQILVCVLCKPWNLWTVTKVLPEHKFKFYYSFWVLSCWNLVTIQVSEFIIRIKDLKFLETDKKWNGSELMKKVSNADTDCYEVVSVVDNQKAAIL